MTTTHSKAQIVATIGPASCARDMLKAMIEHQMDVVRLNFSWGDLDERVGQIGMIRELAKEIGRHIPIIQDLPGPRIQEGREHTYDRDVASSLTDQDKSFIRFGAEQGLEYVALSFVGGAADIEAGREAITACSGKQRIIAKVERRIALENIDAIIAASDAVMVARGDLGNEIPLEAIPFAQSDIIKKCKAVGKPVITATQMMLSMVENPVPTRAEVTDVANAILEGSDAVMLSEESAQGKHPLEAIKMMERILVEAEKHMNEAFFNPL